MKLMIFLLLFVQGGKPEIRIPDLERLIHNSINLERRADETEPLTLDDALSAVARAHSEDMVKRGYFKHVDPEGLTPMKRLENAGYKTCRLVGENIYQNNLYSRATTEKKRTTYDWNSIEEIAASTVRGWMGSPGHRQVILEKDYTRTGVGVSIGADDKVYITQVFCGSAN